jgi:hypothetical protein
VDAFDIDIDNLRNELTNLVKELQKKKWGKMNLFACAFELLAYGFVAFA